MYCKNCGANIADGSRFCPDCGAKFEEASGGAKTLRLKCRSCQANMEVDASRQEAACPYCGEKMMILDSDAVAAEKIKTSAYKEVEFAKMENEKANREAAESKEEKENYKKGKLAKWSIIFVFICLMMTIYSFSKAQFLAGFIALIQTGLFAVSWLMGMKIIKEPRKSVSTAIAILGFILIIPFCMSSSSASSTSSVADEKLEWPRSGLAATLPTPESKYGRVWQNSGDVFRADIAKASANDYEDYLASCIDAGYNVDAKPNGYNYVAYNADGNQLTLDYLDFSDEIDVSLISASKVKELKEAETSAAPLETTEATEAASEAPETTTAAPPETTAATSGSTDSSGINKELKAFLDSYEAFVDEYVAFMKKYAASSNPLSLMTQYTEMMQRYNDFATKAYEFDTSKMTEKELAYYLEVIDRCTQKAMSAF